MPDKRDPFDLYRPLHPAAPAGHAPATPGEPHPAVIASVDANSPAAAGGLKPRDEIVRANDVVLRDIIDWRWYADGPGVSLELRNPVGHERTAVLGRSPGESWGIEFEHLVFDSVKTCRNDCAFCFVSQLPKGLRRPLYVRDDDYRLSFLQGNFITLTNLVEKDIERIDEQHLSPLYVSLHSVDPVVRSQLVCARQDDALARFDQLVELGIEMHVQIVLVPGENDASRLDQTLTWLAMHEGVPSVGVVPVGFTKHQDTFCRSYENARDAAAVIDQVEPWRQAMRRRDGISWVHLADEFYVNARRPVPAPHTYDGYPQYENGIGLVSTFTEEFSARAEDLKAAADAWRAETLAPSHTQDFITLVSGTMFAPVLEGLVSDLGLDDVLRVIAVQNHFFGGNVGVTGLLTDADLSAAIRSDESTGVYLLPDVVGNADGVTLDDVPLDDIAPRTGRDVRLVSSDAAGLVDGIRSAVDRPPSQGPRSR